jgi:ABC-type dipeptide/oligopeptide/nickel transport system permease subunit
MAPLVAGSFIVLLLLVALLADRLVPYDPLAGDYSAIREPPSIQHPFGTDDVGRDVLARVAHGARISLAVGLGAVFTGDLLGFLWGLSSGYLGRRFDLVSQRLLEVIFAFPSLILAAMLMLVIGAGLHTVIIAIAVTRLPASTRLIRSVALSTRELAFVEAARAAGAAPAAIMLRHVAPSCFGPILVVASVDLAIAISTEAALSFLGVGVPPPAPSWGTMLAGSAAGRFSPLWWQALFPGLAITLTVLAVNTASDGLRDLLDPRAQRGGG